MSTMTREQINTFVDNSIDNSHLPADSVKRSATIISQGLIPLTYDNLVNLKTNSPHPEIRDAAEKGFLVRFEKAGAVAEVGDRHGFNFDQFTSWLGVDSSAPIQKIIDRAVEYGTVDVTMTLDPKSTVIN